jgi:hypothetical protein
MIMWHVHGGGFSFHCSVYKTMTMSVAHHPGLFCVASSKTTTMSATCHPNIVLCWSILNHDNKPHSLS